MSTATLAVPESGRIAIISTERVGQDIRFAYLSNEPAFGKWGKSILGLFTPGQQTTGISRIEILPISDIHTRQGEPVALNAVAYSANGSPVSGVKFDWAVQDVAQGGPFRHLRVETFSSTKTGSFIVKAAAGGIQARASITVGENPALLMMQRIQQAQTHGSTALIAQLRAQGLYTSSSISSRAARLAAARAANLQSAQQLESKGVRARPHGPLEPAPETEESSANSGRSRMLYRPADQDGWDNSNWGMATDPGNSTGNPPGGSPDAGAANGNFQFSAPVVSLPGRNIDIGLSLNYNSRVWSKSGSLMTFDAERGFPAPGWSLGFGKMMFMGTSGGCMLIDADGTNHGYAGTISSYSFTNYSSTTFDGNTTDGTFTNYHCDVSTLYGVTSMSGYARLANGTWVSYYAYSANGKQAFPTQIIDTQGNYINVSYHGGHGPAIQTVTDTLGRVITFNYDSLDRLTSVDVPKLDNGGTRTAVRLHYRQITLNPGFAPGITTDTNNSSPYVVDAIYYPGTGTGYWFGADSGASDFSTYYSSYGMLAKIVEQRGMGWSGTPCNQGICDQGTITAGSMSKRATYDLPLLPNYSLTDAPTYSALTETWDGIDKPDSLTQYSSNSNDSHIDSSGSSVSAKSLTVTQPNGVISKQYSYKTGDWKDGLIFYDETDDPNISTPLSSSLVNWEQGDYASARPNWTKAVDEKTQTLRTEYSYGPHYNQLTSQRQYDYDGVTLLKESRSTYENSSAYTDRHLFNLVKTAEEYDGGGNRVSKTDYEYDGNAVVNGTGNPNLKATPDVTMHRSDYDPFTTDTVNGACTLWFPTDQHSPECTYEGEQVWVGLIGGEGYYDYCSCQEYEQVSAYDPNTIFRGNVTKVTVYTDAANAAGSIARTRQYDTTGNLVAESASCCELKTFDYTVTTQYAYPTTQTSGSSDPNSTLRISTSGTYDFNTGLIETSTDANNRTSTFAYNADTLRPTTSTASTGAYSQMTYNESDMTITEEIKDSDGYLAGTTKTYLNGLGLTKRQDSVGPNNITDIVETKYNELAEVWKESRPYRSGDTVQWSEKFYDLQGRLTKITGPDGSETKAFYNESQHPDSATLVGNNLAPGSTIRVMDAWGRERWGRYDALGHLAEVVEPNPDRSVNATGSIFASGSLITKYTYDTLSRLTQVDQGSQVRKFKYDSLGRLTRQKLAEQTATLSDTGQYVTAADQTTPKVWAEAFVYDDRSNLIQKTDARGVRTNYSYQINGADDPLNRIQSRSYDTSGPLEPNLPIENVWGVTVSYNYMTTGDQDRIREINTSYVLTEDFSYDPEGRVSEYMQTIAGRENYPMTMDYLYDTLDRVTQIKYPAQYGVTGVQSTEPRKVVTQSYDTASRLLSLQIDGTEVAGNLSYNASDQTTQIKIGPSGTNQNQVTENYAFDPQTGLLTSQTATQNGNQILNLSYDYNRNNSVGTLNGKTGHLTKILNNLDHNKDHEYEFDVVGRLTKAKGGLDAGATGVNAHWTESYSYDRYGNRASVTATGVAADNSTMPTDGIPNLTFDNASNRITTTGFLYDVAGNQIRALAEDGVTWLKYEYDAANRLRVVRKDDTNQTVVQAFMYGSSNARLIDYDAGAGLNTFICSVGGSTLAQYTEYQYPQYAFSWTKLYTYLGDSQLSTITPNGTNETTEYDHPDQLGTRKVTNQQAGTSYEQTTLPFGKAFIAESTGSTSKRFTSYERSSPTGLDYAVNRTYDSKLGRFTQVDPIGMESISLAHPQTLNLYSYCGNDPINHTDSSGLFWGSLFKWIGKIFKAFSKILKWVFVAIVVAAVVIAAVYSTGAALSFLNSVFGFIGNILGISVQSTPFIYTMATGAGTGGGFSISVGIGSHIAAGFYAIGMASSFAQGPHKKSKVKNDVQSVVNRAVNGALGRIKGKCKTYIEGSSGLDAKSVMETIQKRSQVTYDQATVGDGNVARSTEGKGFDGTIYVGDEFFKDNPGGWVNKSGPRGFQTATKFRQLTILHELRHVVTGITHESETNEEFNKKIAKYCF